MRKVAQEVLDAIGLRPRLVQVVTICASMYVRERSGRLRGGETGQDDVRTRERGEEESSSGDGGEESVQHVRRRRGGGSMRSRRRQQQQEVAEIPSLVTRAVGSVIKLVRVAEFEILFISFFVLAVLLFKDLALSALIRVRLANPDILTLKRIALPDPNTIKYWCKGGLKSKLDFTEVNMFKNTFQSGFLSIFYSLGSKPLQIWDTEAQNGHVRRCVDEDIQSSVLEIVGTNVSSNFITCPADPRLTLGIKLPILVMIIKNMKKYFTFEVQVVDDKNVRRRFRVSNFQSVTRVKPYICTMPMRLDEGWNQIQINLADFTRRAYGTNYVETLRVQVHANCRVRRIYFADRLYSEEELPPEFKFFLPIQKS